MKPVVVRGGGDLASGTILTLSHAGYPVIVLESRRPSAIRRAAAFSEAVYTGYQTVEDITITCEPSFEDAVKKAEPCHPVLVVDPEGALIGYLRPDVVVDAILAKKNIGTTKEMAPLVIALGPGFTAGEDCDYVIETMRGHNLGRIIRKGSALPNTGVPGNVGGYTKERVIHAPAAGTVRCVRQIADLVEKGEVIAFIERDDGTSEPVYASLGGVLRGILPEGFFAPRGMKMADIDPRREETNNCFTVSDKARCIAGSVLELITAYEKNCLI
jgi:xanthine dehydrogenase accessory factor